MANEWARKVGQMLRHVRPGMGGLASSRLGLASNGMTISSPAFEDGGTMPDRYTQDGESLFPPLYWDNIPPAAKSLVLIVEDADAPFPRPLVHAVLHSIPPNLSGIPEGGVASTVKRSPLGFKAGRNSVARAGWLAPSPMPGHGPHRYAFQLLAVDAIPSFTNPPSRGGGAAGYEDSFDCFGADYWGLSKVVGRKQFFFERKNQKTFDCWLRVWGSSEPK